MTTTRCGFVALIGRPNVGKSTLLNYLIGQKISITSPKPQTTRCQVLGIKTLEHNQIIYIDTPGMHRKEPFAINRYMNRMAQSVLIDADVILFMIEAEGWRDEDEWILSKLKKINKPVVLLINKIDVLKDKQMILPFIDHLKEKFNFSAMIPLSALSGNYLQELERELISLLPEGPFLFPKDQVTDKNLRFRVAEIIREKLIRATQKELPYATMVEVEHIQVEEKLIKISAIIWVERPGQKGIVIGKNGQLLKKIGMEARKDIEHLLDRKVFLQLWVKIKAGWTNNEESLKRLGFE